MASSGGLFSLNLSYERGHFAALDGLRGVAVILVLLHHCFRFVPYSTLQEMLNFGWVGVDLFFVLSGFLITGILVDSKGKPRYFRNFIARRTLRIFPLYYLVLGLFFLAVQVADRTSASMLVDNQVYFWTYTQNYWFAFSGFPDDRILNHFWSLAIEEQFYLFWPFVVRLLSVRSLLLFACAGIGLSLLLRNLFPDPDFAFTFTLARIDCLLIGAGTAVLIRERRSWLEAVMPAMFIITASLLLLILLGTKNSNIDNPWFIRVGYTIIAVFGSTLLVLPFDSGIWGRVFRAVFTNSVLRFFGRYSYGIYVYHWILYVWAYEELVSIFESQLVATTVFLSIAVCVSVLSYHLFEKQFLALRRLFL